MTKCTRPPARFPACKGRQLHVDFRGGAVTSDGGALLLRQVDRKLQLTGA